MLSIWDFAFCYKAAYYCSVVSEEMEGEAQFLLGIGQEAVSVQRAVLPVYVLWILSSVFLKAVLICLIIHHLGDLKLVGKTA